MARNKPLRLSRREQFFDPPLEGAPEFFAGDIGRTTSTIVVEKFKMDGFIVNFTPEFEAALEAEGQRYGLSMWGLMQETLQLVVDKGFPALMAAPGRGSSD